MLLDVQFNPARNSWPILRDAYRAADDAGFDGAWVYDHLAGRSLDGDHMFEAWTLLGALATSTSRIELGTLVTNVNNRQPAVLAVAAATLEAIGGRRVLLGIGAGTAPRTKWAAEMEAVGQTVAAPLAARHARVVETLDVLDAVLAADRDDDVATFPTVAQPPLVIIGLNSVSLATLAGQRADGINIAWHHPRRDELCDAALAARADRPGFCLTTWTRWDDGLLDPEHPERRAMAARGIARLVLVQLGRVDPGHVAAARPVPGPVA